MTSFAEAPSRARRLIQRDDTIISTVRTYLRAVWPVRENVSGVVVSTGFAVLTPGKGIEPRYLGWLIQSDLVVEEVVARSVGVSYPAISANDIGNIRVPLPSWSTQRAIADYLDVETARIDRLIEKKQRITELLMYKWRCELVDRLAPHLQTHSGDSQLPTDWRMSRLRRLVDRVVGGSWGSEQGVDEVDAVCVRAADFDFPGLEATEGVTRSFGAAELSRRATRPGDFILEKSGGGDEAPVGRVVQWNGVSIAMPTNFAARLRVAPGVDSLFALYCFRAAYEVGYNWRSIKQTTGIQNLDSNSYLAESWPIPPLEEQRRIATSLKLSLANVLKIQSRLREQVGLLRERRQTVITAAVTAQLGIPEVTHGDD